MQNNLVKLFQDARIESVETQYATIYIIYSEELDKNEIEYLETNYDLIFISDSCCIVNVPCEE